MEAGNPEPFVTVVCPTCRARLNPRRELIGKRVRCPDCGVAVRVTERAAQHVPAGEPAVHGEYDLSEGDRPRDQRPRVLAVCGTCGAKLYPRADLAGRRVRCPDCFKPVVVPRPTPEHKVRERKPVGEYRMDAEPPPLPLAELISTAAPDKPLFDEPAIPLPAAAPQRWYLTGVFSFPGYPGTMGRFAALAIALLLSNFMSTVLFVSLRAANKTIEVGDLFAVLALVLAGIVWSLSLAFASGCIVAVIRDTASGNDEVADWSDAEIYEGLFCVPYIVFPLLAAGAIAWSLVAAVALAIPVTWYPMLPWVAFAATAFGFSLYLAMLVSALEQDAWYLIFSREGLRLILGYLSGWLLVNAMIGGLSGLWLWLTLAGMSYYPYATVFFGAAPMAAIVLIDARLLGRFLYRASEVVHEKEARAAELEADAEETLDEVAADE